MVENVIGFIAATLSIINGIFIIKFYLRDRPKLQVNLIHPDIYNWWFRMPDGIYEGQPTRRFGFIIYVAIINKGLRAVSLSSYRLYIKSASQGKTELKPYNMPEPKMKMTNDNQKIFPVLGQQGLFFKDTGMVESGGMSNGMIYYKYDVYGPELWDPIIKDGIISGTIVVKDIFGKATKKKISCKEMPFAKINEIVPKIDEIP